MLSSWVRTMVAAVVGVAAAVSPTPPGGHPSAGSAVPRGAAGALDPARAVPAPVGAWAWPLRPVPEVRRGFDPPSTAYGRGHRGVDLAPRAPGTGAVPVRAVADGVLTHVSVLAGRGTVTVTHPGGLRSTYEPVTSALPVGTVVHRGDRVGTLEGPSHCDPALTCLHLGAIRDGVYVDPMRFLLPRPVILLPLP